MLVVLLAAAVCAAPADARPSRASAALAHALQVGATMWPTACSPVTIQTGDTLPAAMALTYVGPVVPECLVILDRHWTTWSSALLCSVLAHEIGHLAGQEHNDDRRSVMYGGHTVHIPQCPGPWWGTWIVAKR